MARILVMSTKPYVVVRSLATRDCISPDVNKHVWKAKPLPKSRDLLMEDINLQRHKHTNHGAISYAMGGLFPQPASIMVK